MNDMKQRIRTVKMGKRGQLVIPEDIRKDLEIEDETVLILIERYGEIILKKESEILKKIEDEEVFWKYMSQLTIEKMWSKEDEIWDKIYESENK